MTMNAMAMSATTVTLRLIDAGDRAPGSDWWARSRMRSMVGDCPDHWWKPTARRTASCTCDRA